MARDYIPITLTSQQGSTLKTAILALRQAYAQLSAVRAIMTHQNDGNNFSDLEASFGLPTGKGQAVFDLVNGAVGSMEGSFQVPDAKNLTEQVG